MSDSDEDWGDESVLDIYKKQLKERLARKDRNRKVKSWPEEAALKKLDTNIRKNSAFVKAKLESLRENDYMRCPISLPCGIFLLQLNKNTHVE